MKKILLFIDKYSFKQLFFIAIILTSLAMTPIFTSLSTQKTTMNSKASGLPVITPTPIFYGSIPKTEPKINGVKPYIGKEGDEIVVWGENFGEYPLGGTLYIGNTKIASITIWKEKEIRFIIPNSAISSLFSIRMGNWNVTYGKPITIYDRATTTTVHVQNGRLEVLKPINLKKVVVWADNKDNPLTKVIETPVNETTWVFPDVVNNINWISLYNAQDQLLPFIQNPIEFQ